MLCSAKHGGLQRFKSNPLIPEEPTEAAKQLIAVVDGGHLKSKNKESQSFEAMIATVYRHGSKTGHGSKTVVFSEHLA